MKKIEENFKYVILGVLVFFTIISVLITNGASAKENDSIVKENNQSNEKKYYYVDIKGEVKDPGVYKLKEGSRVIDAINANKYDTIILNYANPDMVGHTGSLPAAIKAVETIDECVGKVVDAILAHHGTMLITADHGNCEQMIDYKTGEPHTAHTTNPVPLILVTENENLKIKEGKLADLAPTMLELLGIEKPAEMTGESILVK